MTAEYLAEVVTFVVMLGLIVWKGWPFVRKQAELQQDRISAALVEAAKARETAEAAVAESREQLEAARRQADAIIAQARAFALDEAKETARRAEADSAAIVAQATTQIAVERDRAISDLRREMSRLVIDAAGRAVGGALSDAQHETLIRAGITRVAGKN